MFLVNLRRIRFIFKKPLHNNILLYDGISKSKMDSISKKYAVFYNRYEEINLYVLFYTIFTNGLKDIKKNYKVNFFKFISPKVIITFNDCDPAFFMLKNIYKDCKYISVQSTSKPKHFYKYIKDSRKKIPGCKFFSDYIFVFGQIDLDNHKKIIDGKILKYGSFENNKYLIKKKNLFIVKKKLHSKEILFISSFNFDNQEMKIKKDDSFKKKLAHFILIFNKICKICIENNYKLSLLSKDGEEFESTYRNYFKLNNWNYIPKRTINGISLASFYSTSGYETIPNYNYEVVNNSFFVVTDHSTMAYEALVKHKRVLIIPSKQVMKEIFYGKLLKNSILFIQNPTYSNIELRIKKMFNYSPQKWNVIARKYSSLCMAFNKNNKVLKKYLRKCIKN